MMPRSKSRAIDRSSARSARSRWATPGGSSVAAIKRSLSDVAVRLPRSEPSASCSGPMTWLATNTTAIADERRGERGAVGDGRDQPARRSRRWPPAATPRSDQSDPPRHGVAGRGPVQGGEQRPLLAAAQPLDHPASRGSDGAPRLLAAGRLGEDRHGPDDDVARRRRGTRSGRARPARPPSPWTSGRLVA